MRDKAVKKRKLRKLATADGYMAGERGVERLLEGRIKRIMQEIDLAEASLFSYKMPIYSLISTIGIQADSRVARGSLCLNGNDCFESTF